MKSIISNERECWLCKTTQNLHKHHIFYGTANRKKSEAWGCWVYLCGYHHNLSKYGVHFDKDFDRKLKSYTQERFEEIYDNETFIKVFKRNFKI